MSNNPKQKNYKQHRHKFLNYINALLIFLFVAGLILLSTTEYIGRAQYTVSMFIYISMCIVCPTTYTSVHRLLRA